MTKLYSNHASLEAKREKMQLLPDFLNLADGAVPMRQWDCSRDPEILDLLKRMPRRYASELKLLLEVLINAPPQTVVDLRRQLTG